MGKKYIYIRVSTEKQDFAQQMECIRSYFARKGIDPTSIDSIVQEKVSGTIDARERKISDLLDICTSGDTIFISELSRIARETSDTIKIVKECCKRDINLIECKEGALLESNTTDGNISLLFRAYSAEAEVTNIRQRTTSRLDAIKLEIKTTGKHISKAGNIITHLGREKGCDNTKANIASAISRKLKAEEWRDNSDGFQTVKRWVLVDGWSNKLILSQFNALHKINPKVFSTRTGLPLSLSTLKQWRVIINEEIKEKIEEEISKQKV